MGPSTDLVYEYPGTSDADSKGHADQPMPGKNTYTAENASTAGAGRGRKGPKEGINKGDL
jgi:hypothetical protein